MSAYAATGLVKPFAWVCRNTLKLSRIDSGFGVNHIISMPEDAPPFLGG